jgi:hypothetical protein
MALASPKLKLPNVAEQLAFRCVDQILRSDPILQTTVKAWRSWRGDPEDILDPTFATCPYLRISPAPGTSRWETEQQHRMPINISIQAAVAGSDADQLMNFWGAIRGALYPNNSISQARLTTVMNMVNAANIAKSQLTMSGYGVMVTNEGLRMLIAKGNLEVILLVFTP